MDYNVQKVPNTGESKPLDATTPGGEVPQDPVDQIHEVQGNPCRGGRSLSIYLKRFMMGQECNSTILNQIMLTVHPQQMDHCNCLQPATLPLSFEVCV